MPRVFEKDGYRFFFYSNDHQPIHVHVRYGIGEAVFNVDPIVELRESAGEGWGAFTGQRACTRTPRAYHSKVA